MTPKPPQSPVSPAYLRGLVDASGLTQEACAHAIGIGTRTLQAYISEKSGKHAPYPVQFTLEALAKGVTTK